MASYIVPPLFAAFVWWFSTGAVLLIVGHSGRFDSLRVSLAILFCCGGLLGLAVTSDETNVFAAYAAFTCALLVWAAQEIAFLAGWITGPRAEPCPDGASGWYRFSLALRAILYHELALIASGVAVAVVTWQGDNQLGLWTFAALWLLRLSAKINLFLGVPVTNDELIPDGVRFLKTFFARKSVSAFFPISVTLATAALVVMLQRITEVTMSPFEVAGWALVSTLFALGVLEHWFMLLPLPALTLWGWGIGSRPVSNEPEAEKSRSLDMTVRSTHSILATQHDGESVMGSVEKIASPHIVELADIHDESKPKTAAACARQRLEDEFRRTFIGQHACADLTAQKQNFSARSTVFNGRST